MRRITITETFYVADSDGARILSFCEEGRWRELASRYSADATTWDSEQVEPGHCPRCDSDNVGTERGDMTCEDCGFIID